MAQLSPVFAGCRGFQGEGLWMLFFKYVPKAFWKVDVGYAHCLREEGAISESWNPAMPHPTRVTRKVSSGRERANSMNSSTYGLISSMPPCMVGIPYDCPCRPVP